LASFAAPEIKGAISGCAAAPLQSKAPRTTLRRPPLAKL